jgi:hypothetical protein
LEYHKNTYDILVDVIKQCIDVMQRLAVIRLPAEALHMADKASAG